MYFNDLEEIMAILVAVAILGGFIVSTIHDMKGGEDDNVVLLTESTPAAVNDDEQQDDEHRVFYTGVTRTRKNLHIIDTESKFKYKI